ncbi:M60 family metallopeptidase [Flavobacterium cerinum]|uniref:M60 family metallopeptidase n=1 Tax=Flavobacterium cerinum TaxID=2502784 RepID=A0ABY5IRC0_9FLAO|nr:M60 family metallopeptidase [Flavobacterium cerinum]UUC45405.1 M60 family metallopeptidase [Flavobacterium cerinum]
MNKHLLSLLCAVFLLSGNIKSAKAQTFSVKPFTAISKGRSQNGQGPEKSYDGNNNTLYHSIWNTNRIPDTLDYYFTNVRNIDSLTYTPRQDHSPNGRWGNVEIWATSAYSPNFQLITTVNWQETKDVKTLKLPGTGIKHPSAIRFVVKSAYGNNSSIAEMAFYSPFPQHINTPHVFEVDSSLVANLGDIKIPVQNGTASNYQPGSTIERSFDGNQSTLYHSNHSKRTFPIALEYDFTNIDQLDYIVYHPRRGNKNGLFGRIKVEARTKTSSYQTLIEAFDCEFKNTPSLIRFPSGFANPAQVRITILSGYNNFASAAEIEFYQKGTLKNDYQTIFANRLYSELRQGITQQSIDTISALFFKKLAQDLLKGNYDKKFRIQSYSAIPSPSKTREKLNLAFEYSRYQNPTGIVFENNSTAIIFVDQYNTDLGLISLKVRNFADETSGQESAYILKPGLNKFTLSNGGLGYIDYYSMVPDLPKVKINIASGSVNGYLSYEDTVENWRERVSSSVYPKIDLIGNHVGINILKRPLLQNALFNGKEVLQKWDSIVKIQFHQMGLVKYDLVPQNKMFAWVESKSGYYAVNNYAHFDLTWGEQAMTSADNLGIWGISHEFGHQNQILNGLKWTGTTEVTNNIYSAYTSYLFNKSKLTRLETANDLYQDTRLTGNLYNIYYNETGRKQQNIMSRPNVFERLIPFWQLQLFYAIAGAGIEAPTLEQVMANKNITGNTDYANWLGITAQTIRNQTTTNIPNGQQMMNFTKYVSDAVQQDLTEFFTKAGFYTPLDAIVNDYTPARITVTEADIEAAKAYITSKGYPKPQSPVIHYITAQNMHMYQNNLSPEGIQNSGFTIDSITVPGKIYYKITHDVWQNAVAFETIDSNNEVLFITTYATGDLSKQTTTVLFPENAVNILAVGADGTRLPILDSARLHPNKTFNTADLQEEEDQSNDETITIAPNPVTDNFVITVENSQIKAGSLVDFNGQVVKQFPIEHQTRVTISDLKSGIYFIVLETSDGSRIVKKIMIHHL